MTDKQLIFVNEYLKDCNATQAAIRAGYSPNSANEQGSQIKANEEVRAEIDRRLALLTITANEVVANIENTAKSSLSNYFVPTIIEHTPRIRVGLQQLIDDLQNEIEFEEEVSAQIEMDEDELAKYEKQQKYRRDKIIRYSVELARNPLATRIVNGETELIESTTLDMKMLMADKSVRIKSVKPTQFGLSVETYAADAADDKLARMYGLYNKDESAKGNVHLHFDAQDLLAGESNVQKD